VERTSIDRMLNPRSVAVVGASEPSADNIVRPTITAGVEVHLVNPNHRSLYGRPCYPSLVEVPAVDCVVSLVNASRTVEVVATAAERKVGGVVITAAGFREKGPEGAVIEAQLSDLARAHHVAICGPNGLGLVNFRSGVHLSRVPCPELRIGGTAIVSHSGGLIRNAMSAAVESRVGVGHVISAGNEAVTDVADYLEFFAGDPDTHTVCLILESIRRPEAFLRACEAAVRSGTTVVAMPLARGSRARHIAASHTAAILADPVIYDAAFGSSGIIVAEDIDDLMAKARAVENLPPRSWPPVHSASVITVSGGAAGLASDVFERAVVPLPLLSDAQDALGAVMQTPAVLNPLDISGWVYADDAAIRKVLEVVLSNPAVDVLVFGFALAEHEEQFARRVLDVVQAAAVDAPVPILATSIENCRLGAWTDALTDITVIRGLHYAAQLVQVMRRYSHPEPRSEAASEGRIAVPPAGVSDRPGVALADFGAMANVIRDLGVPIAPYTIIAEPETIQVPRDFGDRLVVKLANVVHRDRIGAIRKNVSRHEVAAAREQLDRLAASLGCDRQVIVQPQIDALAEVFVGLMATTPFGPVIVCGTGGTEVESGARVAARLAPVGRLGAEAMLRQAGLDLVLVRRRQDDLVEVLLAVSRLAARQDGWLSSLDLNPILVTEDGLVAVDVSCMLVGGTDSP
jgi:acyl-CoA synthetase (NDP forming)